MPVGMSMDQPSIEEPKDIAEIRGKLQYLSSEYKSLKAGTDPTSNENRMQEIRTEFLQLLSQLPDRPFSIYQPPPLEPAAKSALITTLGNAGIKSDSLFLHEILQGLTLPRITDRNSGEHDARREWRKKMEQMYGDLFVDTYEANPLRSNKLGVMLGLFLHLFEYKLVEPNHDLQDVIVKGLNEIQKLEDDESKQGVSDSERARMLAERNQVANLLLDYLRSWAETLPRET